MTGKALGNASNFPKPVERATNFAGAMRLRSGDCDIARVGLRSMDGMVGRGGLVTGLAMSRTQVVQAR
jgi:hypothetical protein